MRKRALRSSATSSGRASPPHEPDGAQAPVGGETLSTGVRCLARSESMMPGTRGPFRISANVRPIENRSNADAAGSRAMKTAKDLCRKHGFSEGSYYLWRRKFGGMSVSDAQRLKELELENTDAKSCWPTRSWRTRRAAPSN